MKRTQLKHMIEYQRNVEMNIIHENSEADGFTEFFLN